MFKVQPANEKRRLLNFLLSNCSWKRGALTVDFKEPFDFLLETITKAAEAEAAKGAEFAKNRIWLRD